MSDRIDTLEDVRTDIRLRFLAVVALLAATLLPAASASADVDDFSYASWTSEYVITTDAENRSHAHVTETLVARFPEHDQNRGIVRGLAERYEGANLHTTVTAITDGDGQPVPYETESDDDTLYLLLGDDDYVHGLTTYVIEYTMRDVILAATESGNDEFYWNFLPLNSTQSVESFSGSVTLSSELSAELTGDVACYEGYRGSTTPCTLTEESLPGGETRFSVSAQDLPARYGVTAAIGLRDGTVAQPSARLPNPVLDVGPFAIFGAATVAALGAFVGLLGFRRRKRTATGIVVAQYSVPDDLPPLVAAAVYPGARDAIAANTVHLAVRGVVRIEDPDKGKTPRLRLIDPAAAPDSIDARLRDALFPEGAGPVMQFPAKSETFARAMKSVEKGAKGEAHRRGLLARERAPGSRVLLLVTALLVAAGIVLAFVGVATGREIADAALAVTLIGGVIVLLAVFIIGRPHPVHTAKGAEAHEYLQGVREFIRVAEADRLRMLQSHGGAERYREGSTDVVHVYERLLPYAMLFGEEKSWGRVLEVAYAASQSHPTWINTYAAVSFSSQLSAFSSGARSAATYSSSSSGGSTGGGFSGGGGGGGFSGGR